MSSLSQEQVVNAMNKSKSTKDSHQSSYNPKPYYSGLIPTNKLPKFNPIQNLNQGRCNTKGNLKESIIVIFVEKNIYLIISVN